MATNNPSSTEDAELVDEIAAKAEDAVSDLTDTASEIENQAEDALTEAEHEAQDLMDGDEHPQDEEPAEEHHAEEHEAVYEEERRSSLAGRFLWLLLLLLGGAGLALWGGPKLAPMLPEPLQPLAKYLTPGASEVKTSLDEVNTEIAALRTDTQAKIEALPAPVGQAAIDEAIAKAVGTARTETEAAMTERTDKLAADLAALSDKVTAADSGEIEGRLSSLESKIAGMSTEFASLQSALGELKTSTGESDNNTATAELSAELAAKMAAYAASLDGLKAELAEVSTQNGEVRQRIDEVEAATARQISEADARVEARINAADERTEEMEQTAEVAAKAAEIEAAMRNVRAKLDNGAAFSDELAVVVDAAGVDLPEALMMHAENGVPTAASLEGGFGNAASAAIRSSIKADADAGTVSGFRAFLKSQVVTRSLSPQDGDGTDAVLSRMEAGFKNGDLAATLSEAEALPAPAAEAMADWLTKARTRAEALSGFDALNAALSAVN